VNRGGSKTPDVAISVIPFGLAFCAGFSIEVLFSILDRANRMISDSSTEKPVPFRRAKNRAE
jgi:hypothetical protein